MTLTQLHATLFQAIESGNHKRIRRAAVEILHYIAWNGPSRPAQRDHWTNTEYKWWVRGISDCAEHAAGWQQVLIDGEEIDFEQSDRGHGKVAPGPSIEPETHHVLHYLCRNPNPHDQGDLSLGGTKP